MKYRISLILAISFFCIPSDVRSNIPASSLASLPKTLEANYLIKIPSYKGCFTLDIQNQLDFPQPQLDTLFIVGALYDHIEGKTKYLGTLSFPDLQEKISTDDNIFSFAAVPDSAEFLLYVLQKDPQTEEITPLEPLNFLTINFSSTDDQTCDTADATTFQFSSQELEKAQKTWAQYGGYLRAQAKKYWNSLTPRQKRAAKILLITGTAILGALVRKSIIRKSNLEKLLSGKLSENEAHNRLARELDYSPWLLQDKIAKKFLTKTTRQERQAYIEEKKEDMKPQIMELKKLRRARFKRALSFGLLGRN